MDRVEQFKNHHIHESLDQLEESLKTSVTDDLEMARSRKIIKYIRQYLTLIDADLLTKNHFNNLTTLNTYLNKLLNSNFAYNENYTDISDKALQLVLTLPIQVKYAKESITQILQAYNDSIKEGLEQIDLASTKQSAEKIKELEKQLFENYENEKGIDTLINDKYKCIKESYSEINEYYNEVLGSDDSIKDQVETAKDKILEIKVKVEEEADNFEEKLVEFKKYYKKVFGFENEDGEETVGLKKELDKRKDQLDILEKDYKTKLEELEKSHKTKYETLEEEINSLVDGATSAGLAKAFDEESTKFDDSIKWWDFGFIISIVMMCIVYGILSYVSNDIAKNDLDILSNFIIRLPYLLPFIWLGFYAGKRRNESARLKHEYIHKATLAKSYISYKNQINSLQDTDEALIKKLLDSAIDTVGYNPSQTLDKNHNDRTPITELIRLTVEKTTELAKNKKESSKEK